MSGEGRNLGGWYTRKWDLQRPRTWPMHRRPPESICGRCTAAECAPGPPRRRGQAGGAVGPCGLAAPSSPSTTGAMLAPWVSGSATTSRLRSVEGYTELPTAEEAAPVRKMEVWRGSRPLGLTAPPRFPPSSSGHQGLVGGIPPDRRIKTTLPEDYCDSFARGRGGRRQAG